jgi:hypothetical protein
MLQRHVASGGIPGRWQRGRSTLTDIVSHFNYRIRQATSAVTNGPMCVLYTVNCLDMEKVNIYTAKIIQKTNPLKTRFRPAHAFQTRQHVYVYKTTTTVN